MKIFKLLLKYTLYLLFSTVLYIFFSVLLSQITVNKSSYTSKDSETIFIHSNGVHLSIILPVKLMSTKLKEGLILPDTHRYAKFGWGNETFYLNVPTWGHFKLKYAFEAFFLDSPTAIHVTTSVLAKKSWIAIKLSKEELIKMNSYIETSFDAA